MSRSATVALLRVIQRAHDDLRAIAGDWRSGTPGAVRAHLHRIADALLAVLLAQPSFQKQ